MKHKKYKHPKTIVPAIDAINKMLLANIDELYLDPSAHYALLCAREHLMIMREQGFK